MLDTGAPDDGVDELFVYGIDNLAAGFNGYVPGTTTRNRTDDIFLLRAVKCIDTESPFTATAVGAGVPTACTSPSETADSPAFVALLAGNGDPTAASACTATASRATSRSPACSASTTTPRSTAA